MQEKNMQEKNMQEQIKNLLLNKQLLQEIQELTKTNQIEQQKSLEKSTQTNITAIKQISSYNQYIKKTQTNIFNLEKYINNSFNKIIKENQKLFSKFIQNITKSIFKTNSSSPFANIIGSVTKSIFGFEKGGIVKGQGSEKSDSIIARISNGEFIVNAASTKKFRPILESINNNRFANGGMVGQNNNGIANFIRNDPKPINIKVEIFNNTTNAITAKPQVKINQNNNIDIKLIINEIDKELANKAGKDQSQLVNFIDQSRSLRKRGI